MEPSVHVSVLRDKVVEMLRASEGGDFLDCTLGGAGHALAMLEAHPETRVSALDRDPAAVERAKTISQRYPGRFTATHATFANASKAYADRKFDGILADLGVSTDQLVESRGFSFADDAMIDMRMDPSQGESAADLLERVSEQELYVILKQGGVGAEARAVASAIIRRRPFNTAKELATMLSALPALTAKKKRSHPATVVFQALRIAVNQEIKEIEAFMKQLPTMVKPGGRVAVITFHSLEDRLVTHQMREWENQGSAPASYPMARRERVLGRVLTRKAIEADGGEIAHNPASRSARLRVFEFVNGVEFSGKEV